MAIYTPTSDATMQTAIAALADSDTITISGSWTSTVRYTIPNNSVIINSSSASNKITLGTNDNYAFYLSGDNITCGGFQIDCDKANRTTGTGIILVGDTITVSGMTILNAYNYGILVAATSQGNVISGNTITNAGVTGFSATTSNCIRINSGGTGTISGNILSSDSDGSDIVFVNASSGITITGNTISGGDAGIHMYGVSNSAVITNNIISDIGIATDSNGADFIALSGTNSIVTGNVGIQTVAPVDVVAAYESMGGANACDGSVISYNTFSGANLGIGLLGGGSTITVNANSISTINGSIQQNCIGSTFTNNYFVCSSATPTYGGLRLDSNAAGARNATVYNNTFVGAGGNGLTWFETNGTWESPSAAVNNIFTGWAKGIVIYGTSVADHTYNDYWNCTANVQSYIAAVYANLSPGTGEININPLLTTHILLPDSPCIRAGLTIDLVTNDIDGRKRPGRPGNKYSIGAWEYLGTNDPDRDENCRLPYR